MKFIDGTWIAIKQILVQGPEKYSGPFQTFSQKATSYILDVLQGLRYTSKST